MASYLVSLHVKAAESLQQVPAVRKRLIYSAIESLKNQPYPGDEDLIHRDGQTLYFRIMRGGYWITYTVNEPKQLSNYSTLRPT